MVGLSVVFEPIPYTLLYFFFVVVYSLLFSIYCPISALLFLIVEEDTNLD